MTSRLHGAGSMPVRIAPRTTAIPGTQGRPPCWPSVHCAPAISTSTGYVFNEHRAACFSRVALFGTKQRATSHMSKRKRDRDSNTGWRAGCSLHKTGIARDPHAIQNTVRSAFAHVCHTSESSARRLTAHGLSFNTVVQSRHGENRDPERHRQRRRGAGSRDGAGVRPWRLPRGSLWTAQGLIPTTG